MGSDRDEMRDNIERAQAASCGHCGRPVPFSMERWDCPCGGARVRMALYEGTPSRKSWVHERFVYRGEDEAPGACPACVEFGTICRPCRKARYEAGMRERMAAERSDKARRVWLAIAIVVTLVGGGLAAQAVADRQCPAGTGWDAGTWRCDHAR